MSVIQYDPVSELAAKEEDAKEIKAFFVPMLNKMEELEKEFFTLKESINEETGPTKEQCDQAKLLKKKYVKVRTGTADIHKKAKASYLLKGRVVDGWKNAQLLAGGEKENELDEISKHFENLEAQRKAELFEKRSKLLDGLDFDISTVDITQMSEEVFTTFLTGVKESYRLKKEAEEKIEAEKAEAERKQKAYNQRREVLYKYGKFANFEGLTLETTDKEFEGLVKQAKNNEEEDKKEREALKKKAEEAEKKLAAEKKIVSDKVSKFKGCNWDGVNLTYNGNPIYSYDEIFNLKGAKLKNAYTSHNENHEKELEKKRVEEAKTKALLLLNSRVQKLNKAYVKDLVIYYGDDQIATAKEIIKMGDPEFIRLMNMHNDRVENDEAAEAERLAKIEEENKKAAEIENAKGNEKLKLWVNSFPGLPELDLKGLSAKHKKSHENIVNKFEAFKEWADAIIYG